jgi:hypothetical protein
LQFIFPLSFFTKDGGFQAHLRVHYAKMRNFRPMYGSKENQVAIHKSTHQVVARISDSQPHIIYNYLTGETFYKTVRQLFQQSAKEGRRMNWAQLGLPVIPVQGFESVGLV